MSRALNHFQTSRRRFRESSRALAGWIVALLLCAFYFGAKVASAAELSSDEPQLLHLQLTINAEGMKKLRAEPRQYVHAQLREGTRRFDDVAVHLKGSLGSFRSVDAKPALTLSFSKYGSNQFFHGSSKIHLNNSVEDPSYLNEKVGSILFRKAGIPAPGVHHALVELNGRRLGLYVLKEGFTHEFLARNFKDPSGNLYDTDAEHEITDKLQRDLGTNDPSDLNRLAEIGRLTDSRERRARLAEVVDVDEFVTFMAMEIMICHRDGYSLARNNYRLYHDPGRDRFVFLPHGMDQLFQRSDFPWKPAMGGLLAQIVMNDAEGQSQYWHRLQSLVTNIFDLALLTKEIDRTVATVAPALPAREANSFTQAARDLKFNITQRKAFLERELAKPPPSPIAFANGVALLTTNWVVFDPPKSGAMTFAATADGIPCLQIVAGPATAASWRQKVLLSAGTYRFQARVLTRSVAPLPYGKHHGAAIRVAGSPPVELRLIGDQKWTLVSIEFTVSKPTEEVELLCELRASKGEAFFDRSSLKLIPVQDRR